MDQCLTMVSHWTIWVAPNAIFHAREPAGVLLVQWLPTEKKTFTFSYFWVYFCNFCVSYPIFDLFWFVECFFHAWLAGEGVEFLRYRPKNSKMQLLEFITYVLQRPSCQRRVFPSHVSLTDVMCGQVTRHSGQTLYSELLGLPHCVLSPKMVSIHQ